MKKQNDLKKIRDILKICIFYYQWNKSKYNVILIKHKKNKIIIRKLYDII